MRSESFFPFLYTHTHTTISISFISFVTFRNSLHITVIGSHLQNYVNFSLFFLLFLF